MRPLDKKLAGRLFKGYGPLSSFSAKIDLAYALKVTTLEIHNELHKIRDIRNAFALDAGCVFGMRWRSRFLFRAVSD
jgi:hypothetical protein